MPPCFQKCTSLPQIPVAVTWIRHSPAVGEGVGTSTMERSWEGLVVMAMLGFWGVVVVVVVVDILGGGFGGGRSSSGGW